MFHRLLNLLSDEPRSIKNPTKLKEFIDSIQILKRRKIKQRVPCIAVFAPPGEQVPLLSVVVVLGTLRPVLFIPVMELLLSDNVAKLGTIAST